MNLLIIVGLMWFAMSIAGQLSDVGSVGIWGAIVSANVWFAANEVIKELKS